LSLLFYLFSGQLAALSALLGGLIFVLPQLYFALKAFRFMGATSIAKTLKNFYSGESTKLLLIAIGFALVFSFFKGVDVVALFSSFICLLVLNFLTPLLFKTS